MNRENYELLSASLLKDMAKKRGIRGLSAMRKSQVVDALVEYDRQKETAAEKTGSGEEEAVSRTAGAENVTADRADSLSRTAAAERTADSDTPESSSRRSGGENSAANNGEQRSSRYAAGRYADERRPAGTGRSQDNGTRSFRQRPAGDRPDAQRPAGDRSELQRPSAGRPDAQRSAAKPEGQRPAAVRPEAQRPAAVRPEGQRPAAVRPEAQRPTAARPEAQRLSAVRPEGQRPSAARPEVQLQEERSIQSQTDEANAVFLSENDRPPMDLRQLDSGNMAEGVLEVMADGYGFIRSNNYLPGDDDVYVSPSQIRRFNLKTGDLVGGNTRVHTQQEKFSALLFVRTINGMSPSEAARRYNFEDMTPVFPDERLRMERTGRELAMRIVDLLSPIGKGQRGMIVSPPKAGKTTLLKDIARSILRNNPEMHLIIMLIDERPEEVTDIREAIVGENVEVLDSTFDETPEHHRRVAEMGIERAKRLVEHCTDVTILLDSITRLARAYNLIVPPSGRTLSGGLDPAALHPPKRFFGAARNMREGGSLTILATALVDTGSKMDDVVYEEFKGTGNMELILDRKLSERRVFPAIDIVKSGTRRDDLLLDPAEAEAALSMRRALNGMKGEEAVERILDLFAHTRNNAELVARVKGSRII